MILWRFALCAWWSNLFAATLLFAQTAGLPNGWEQLAPSEFVAAVKQLQLNGAIDAEIRAAIDDHAADLLTTTNFIATTTDTGAAESLLRWGGDRLTPEQRSQLLASIDAALPGVESMTFDQFNARMVKTKGLSEPSYQNNQQRREFAAQWVRGKDIISLESSAIDTLLWDYLAPRIRNFEEFEVEWTGRITPSRSGEYTFSISPLNISTQYETASHEQRMSVEVDGKAVVTATPENWQHVGTPIALTGGQAAPLRVRLSYSLQNSSPRIAVGQLYWQGPGLTRQLVPPSTLRLAAADQEGLRAAARWKYATMENKPDSGKEFSETVVAPSIDHVFWGRTLSANNDVLQSLVAERLARLLSQNALEALKQPAQGNERRMHGLVDFTRPDHHLLQYCSSADRRRCAEFLLDHPEAIRDAWMAGMRDLYYFLRPGVEREALDVLGTWMQLNADLPARLVGGGQHGYFKAHRHSYRMATAQLVWEHPESIEWLEEDYLETADGRCALPAAYTLAYAYLVQGKIAEWIEFLEDKLAEPELTGDRRVNWLIARAMAEEIRRGAAHRHNITRERLTAGREWLDEAALVAESPEAKLRLAKERISRLAALHQWDAAEAELQAAPAAPSEWSQILVDLREKAALAAEQRAEATSSAYLAELEVRRQRALSRGDNAVASSYTELINSVEPASNK